VANEGSVIADAIPSDSRHLKISVRVTGTLTYAVAQFLNYQKYDGNNDIKLA
jgi:hypothetical protein